MCRGFSLNWEFIFVPGVVINELMPIDQSQVKFNPKLIYPERFEGRNCAGYFLPQYLSQSHSVFLQCITPSKRRDSRVKWGIFTPVRSIQSCESQTWNPYLLPPKIRRRIKREKRERGFCCFLLTSNPSIIQCSASSSSHCCLSPSTFAPSFSAQRSHIRSLDTYLFCPLSFPFISAQCFSENGGRTKSFFKNRLRWCDNSWYIRLMHCFLKIVPTFFL